MMRYCLICGECLETHNINRVACKNPECQTTRRRRVCSEAMRLARRKLKFRKLVNRAYSPKGEAA